MKKNRYDAYSNYYYKYSKKKKIKSKLLSIFFVLFSLAVVIFFSISFSNFLNISKIVNTNTNFINNNKTLYALSLYQSTNLETCQNYKEELIKQGGAGYIYFDNNVYNVLSSVYPSLKEANSVKANLEQSGVSSSVLKIELPVINFKINLTTKSREILNEGISLFYNNYLKLYNLSNEYDKSSIDFISLKTQVNNLYESNKNIIENYNNYFNTSSNIYILYLKIYLNKLNVIIKNFQTLDESVNVSSKIKETYCNVLSLYKNLYNEMI